MKSILVWQGDSWHLALCDLERQLSFSANCNISSAAKKAILPLLFSLLTNHRPVSVGFLCGKILLSFGKARVRTHVQPSTVPCISRTESTSGQGQLLLAQHPWHSQLTKHCNSSTHMEREQFGSPAPQQTPATAWDSCASWEMSLLDMALHFI